MALTYPYHDAYLAKQMTPAREDSAKELVAAMGTFPPYWVEFLVTRNAYVITCQELMASPDDVFAAKLAAYRKALDLALPQARAAQAAADDASGTRRPGGGSFYTVDLERG